MKPVRGRETLLLENGDAEGNVGIKSPPFRLWGKEKALTGFPPTLVWFYLINWMYCPWIVFSDAGLHHALSDRFGHGFILSVVVFVVATCVAVVMGS